MLLYPLGDLFGLEIILKTLDILFAVLRIKFKEW
jgi:hypothetical protein